MALDDSDRVYIWDIKTGTRPYEISVRNNPWTRSLTLSSDGTSILLGGTCPLPIAAPGASLVYVVVEDGWVYARSPGRAARLCWLPPEWRNLLVWDGAKLYCLLREQQVLVEFDVSRLPEYVQMWGSEA